LWLFIFEKLNEMKKWKIYLQKVISKKTEKKNNFSLMSWRSLRKTAEYGSISQRYRSADPDPYQNFMNPQHCSECSIYKNCYYQSRKKIYTWWPMPLFLIFYFTDWYWAEYIVHTVILLGGCMWCGHEVVWKLACFEAALTWLWSRLKSADELRHSPKWGSTVRTLGNRPMGEICTDKSHSLPNNPARQ
jgi:hypothetical protein